MKLKNILKKHWQILAILLSYLVFNLYILDFATSSADEATNSLLALFYHDLLLDLLKYPTFSFNKIYNYGITYLTYYPKLTIYYPPLFHFLTVLSYFIFGISIFSAKLVEVTFSLLALLSVYLLGKEMFDKKVALFSVIILMTSPIFVFWSRQALIDIPLIFFFTITGFFYLRWLTKKGRRYFILGIISGTLGILTKWQFLIMFPILFFYTFLEYRKKLKQLIIAFLLTGLIASPYLYIAFKANLLSLQYYSTVVSGLGESEPRWTSFSAWTYYIEKLIFEQFFFPLSLLIAISFLFYTWKGKKHKKFILIWILVFYLFFVYLDNKDARFTMPYLQIFSIIFSAVFFDFTKYRKKYSKIAFFLISILIFIQFYYSFSKLPHFYEPVDKIVSDIFEPGSNILIAAQSVNTHDSVFAFHLDRIDRNFRVRYFRFCTLESIDSLKKYGIKYLVMADPPREDYKPYTNIIYNNIELFDKFKKYEFENQNFTVFVYKEFSPTTNRCNYICLTDEEVCSEYETPIEALK